MIKGDDGGLISLDWVIPTSGVHSKGPTLCILPGLTGHNDDIYMVSTSKSLVEHGWRGVVINHRGCSNAPLTTPVFYHAGSTNDTHFAIDHIR
jgi:predicted alpha/beta-fold hydrolase